MFRRAMTFSAMLFLAGAALFMTADPVQARGGHGGGGHGGGFHGGGHVGGFRGGYHGGYRGGYYHGGYGRGFGYRPYYGYGHYYGGYYPYYGYYNQSYLYGGDSSLENAYADDTPLLNDPVTYDSGYTGLSAEEYQAYAQAATANNAGAATPMDTMAHVTATVPADAEIWIDGTKTTSTGAVRQFQSPPLTPGQPYSYEIRARWNENGHEVTQTQHVEVAAGVHTNVDFPIAPKTAGQVSAVN